MAPQRIDELSSPPIVGRYYLVPTVRYVWCSAGEADWPVLLPRHEDAEHLQFEAWHYHADLRFIGDGRLPQHWLRQYPAAEAMISPISVFRGDPPGSMPDPVWRRRRCFREMPDFPWWWAVEPSQDGSRRAAVFRTFYAGFAGRQCPHNGRGWICPHKGIDLSGMPVKEGLITCPGHGLRIDAATGRIVDNCAAPDAAEPGATP